MAFWGAFGAGVTLAQAGERSDAGVPPASAAGSDEAQLEAGQLSKAPKLITNVAAEYPDAAKAQAIETFVDLVLDIDETGQVASVSILEPSAYPDLGFEEAALVAANQLVFEPAEYQGKPIAVQIVYRSRFEFRAPVSAPDATALGDGGLPADAAAPPAEPEPVANFVGVVRERGTRKRLPGVTLTVFREEGGNTVGYEADSDAAGAFQVFDLGEGTWRVLIDVPGYYPIRTSETIKSGEATEVTYYLEKASYSPYDITVVSRRPRKEVSRTVLKIAEIDKVPGTAGDPLRVIANLPGVARPPP